MATNKILVVEDDENDVFFLQNAFKSAGILISLYVARDGRQAINYLDAAGEFADREKFPLPALILLDLKLPQVMGLDVLRWIRARPELRMPVIILSASKNEADIEAAYRLGANAYLVKPNAVGKLLEMVRAIKDFWLTHNTSPEQNAHPSAYPVQRG
jgi:DNA-binding response OmpR family regulator